MNGKDTIRYKIQALTPIWTGSVKIDERARNGQRYLIERIENERLITSGLLGSIRWWFEVLVRGLGGSACDPSDPANRCPRDSRKQPTDSGHHCVVCEFFGCTGWARKFRFDVLDEEGNTIQHAIEASDGKTIDPFFLCFIPLRSIQDEEWDLLDLTLRLIADYGAIGGRTVLKPSDEHRRQNEEHHRDYGLIKITESPFTASVREVSRAKLEHYVQDKGRWRLVNHNDFSWASVEYFWCVPNRYLTREDANRSSYNKVLGRQESKACLDCGGIHSPRAKCPRTNRVARRRSERLVVHDDIAQWLAGRQQESKKVFSFKEPADARRTFGFVRPGLIGPDEMKARLRRVWTDLRDEELLAGEQVLAKLLAGAVGGRP